MRIVRRVPRWAWATSGLLVLLGVIALGQWVIAPTATDLADVTEADAVVIFVGGRGERLETALEVVAASGSGVLVIPNGTVPTWPDANLLCAGSFDVEVICPTPEPDSTQGEARVFAELAAERGWESVIMVTSTYHLARAELMLTRCFGGSITAVRASPDISAVDWGRHAVHEGLGHLRARIVDRGC